MVYLVYVVAMVYLVSMVAMVYLVYVVAMVYLYKIQKCLFSVILINIKTLAKSYCMTRDMYNIYNIMEIKGKVIKTYTFI